MKMIKSSMFARIFACALFLCGASRLAAATVVFETGGNPSTTLIDAGNGGTILVSGSAGTIALQSGPLAVDDWVQAASVFDLGNRNDLTFRGFSGNPGLWSVIQSTGSNYVFLMSSASVDTLTLDKIVIAGGVARSNRGGAISRPATASSPLTINGDVIFLNNSAELDAGAIWFNGSARFTGTVSFEGNKSGYAAAANVFNTAAHGGAVFTNVANAEFIFEKYTTFFSNTSTARGGALTLGASNTLHFMDGVVFRDNESGLQSNTSFHGGAIYLDASSIFVVDGDALFETNKAGIGGGGFYAGNNSQVTFNGNAFFNGNTAGSTLPTSGDGGGIYLGATGNVLFKGDLTMTNNQAVRYGGAIFGTSTVIIGDPGALASSDNGKKLILTGNFAGNVSTYPTASGGGGAVFANSQPFNVYRDYTITDNHTLGGGGALYIVNLTLNGSGPIANNYALTTGGAIVVATNGQANLYSGAVVENNYAGGNGGAIWVQGSGTVFLNATGGRTGDDIIFQGNRMAAGMALTDGTLVATTAGTPNAIYFNGASNWLNLNAVAGQGIYFNDPITGAVTVVKSGAGAVVFDTYRSSVATNTRVEEGIFRLANGAIYGASVASSTFTLAAGGTLSGNGRIEALFVDLQANSAVEVFDDGLLYINATTGNFGMTNFRGSGTFDSNLSVNLTPALIHVGFEGDTQARELTLMSGDGSQGFTLANFTRLEVDLFANNEADKVHLSGTGAIDIASTGTLLVDVGRADTGVFTVMTWDAMATANLFDTPQVNYNGAAATARNSGTLAIIGESLVLTNTAFSLDMAWNGSAGDGVWTGAPGKSANWSDGGAPVERFFRDGDSVTFGGSGAGTVTVDDAGVTASQIKVEGSNNYTFAGGGINTAASSAGADTKITGGASGKLLKTGAGMLQFANTAANVFEGGIDIGGGVVAFSRADQLQVAPGEAIVFSSNAALRADANMGNTLALASDLRVGSGVNATLDTQGFNLSLSGAITSTDATGVVTKSGTGTLTLLGDSSAFSGTLNANSGRVMLGDNAAKIGGVVSVAPGAVFGGIGSSPTADVTVRAGGMLEAGLGGGVTGTLSLRSVALEADATLQFTLLASGESSRLLVSTPASATVASGTAYINLAAGFASDILLNYNLGNLAALNGKVTVKINGADVDETARQNAGLSVSGNDLMLDFGTDKSRRMSWNLALAQNGVWDGGAANWRDSGVDQSVKNKFLPGDAVWFDGAFLSTVDIQPGASGARVTVSELNVNITGGGTLAFTGSGVFASATTAHNLGYAASGMLVKTGAGALSFANGANYFEGGVLINEGVVELTRGSQLAVASAAAVTFGGDATLRAAADLSAAGAGPGGLVDFGAHNVTFDTNGHNAALTGTTTGAGTLIKTGAGWLELSSTAALGHAATRIDEGLIKLGASIAADAANVSYVFDLNGGWLDLSDTGTGAPANEWAPSLVITGSVGRVIGSNDQITLRAGTHAYQIGGVADEERGVFVVIEGGAATLTGANNYMGYTRIDTTGTLNASADSQLGDTTLAREVILNGGVLRVTDGFDTARHIELRASGTMFVNEGVSTTWAGTVEAPGDSFVFAKDGAGTLVLGGALGHKGGTVVRAGTLQGDAAKFTGEIEALENAAVVVAQTTAGTFSAKVTGGGEWRKTGTALVDFSAGARISAALVSIDAGAVMNQYDNTFAGARDFVVSGSGALAGSGTVSAELFTNRGNIYAPKAAAAVLQGNASLQNYGRLTLAGDYHGDGGFVTLAVLFQDNMALSADQLVITGSVSGVTRLALVTTEVINTSGTNTPLVLTGGSEDGAFLLDKRYTNYYGRDLGIYNRGGDWYLDWAVISPEVPAIIGVDAAGILSGRASLDALASHMSSARIDTAMPGARNLWIQGIHRRDRFEDTLYKNMRFETSGVQAGGEFFLGEESNRGLVLGAFVDQTRTGARMREGASSADVVAEGAGLYARYAAGGFRMDVIVRGSRERYEVYVPETPKFGMKGSSWAASAMAGYKIEGRGEWVVEPEAGLRWQTHTIDPALDSFGRRFSLDSADSLEGRAGLLIWQEYLWRGALRFRPFARASAVREMRGKTVLYIGEPYAFKPDDAFTNDFGGGYGVAEAGFTMELGCGVNFYGQGAYYFGGKIKGLGFNLGLSCAW